MKSILSSMSRWAGPAIAGALALVALAGATASSARANGDPQCGSNSQYTPYSQYSPYGSYDSQQYGRGCGNDGRSQSYDPRAYRHQRDGRWNDSRGWDNGRGNGRGWRGRDAGGWGRDDQGRRGHDRRFKQDDRNWRKYGDNRGDSRDSDPRSRGGW